MAVQILDSRPAASANRLTETQPSADFQFFLIAIDFRWTWPRPVGQWLLVASIVGVKARWSPADLPLPLPTRRSVAVSGTETSAAVLSQLSPTTHWRNFADVTTGHSLCSHILRRTPNSFAKARKKLENYRIVAADRDPIVSNIRNPRNLRFSYLAVCLCWA